ncbi:UNVERIFIED_CONTAM: hypothetical protein FKN15_075907 [Acipenser sinensis]
MLWMRRTKGRNFGTLILLLKRNREDGVIVLWSGSACLVHLVELTVKWEDAVDEAYERKKLRYAHIAAEAEQRGWSQVYPVEGSCRGFVVHSTTRFLTDIGFSGQELRCIVKNLFKAADRSSNWLRAQLTATTRADSGGAKTNTWGPQPTASFHSAGPPCSQPRATASEDNAALGSLQASPPAPSLSTGVTGVRRSKDTLSDLSPPPGSGIAWTQTDDHQAIGRILERLYQMHHSGAPML